MNTLSIPADVRDACTKNPELSLQKNLDTQKPLVGGFGQLYDECFVRVVLVVGTEIRKFSTWLGVQLQPGVVIVTCFNYYPHSFCRSFIDKLVFSLLPTKTP